MNRASILDAVFSLLVAAAAAAFVHFYSDFPAWPHTIMAFGSIFVVIEVDSWVCCRFTSETIGHKMVRAGTRLAGIFVMVVWITDETKGLDWFVACLVTYFAFLLLVWIYLWIRHARKARSSANR